MSALYYPAEATLLSYSVLPAEKAAFLIPFPHFFKNGRVCLIELLPQENILYSPVEGTLTRADTTALDFSISGEQSVQLFYRNADNTPLSIHTGEFLPLVNCPATLKRGQVIGHLDRAALMRRGQMIRLYLVVPLPTHLRAFCHHCTSKHSDSNRPLLTFKKQRRRLMQ